MELLFAKIRSTRRSSVAQNSQASSRAIPLERNSLKLGAKITIWIPFSTPGSRAEVKKQILIRHFLQQVEADDVVFSLQTFESSDISVPLVEQKNCSFPDFEALQVGFSGIQLRAWSFFRALKKSHVKTP
jgi:hypothetical protein